MTDPATCGQGLAEHSALPATLSELMARMAENLEVHMDALDLTDPNARREHAVYGKLAEQQRTIAGQLEATGKEMASHRDLPMGRHDERAMRSPEAMRAFQGFAKAEQELLTLLGARAEQNRQMLVAMGRSGEAGDRP